MKRFDCWLQNQLQPEEQVDYIIRESSIAKLVPASLVLLWYLGWWFGLAWVVQFGSWGLIPWLIGLAVNIIIALRLVWLWHYDVAIVTNKRLLDRQQHSIWRKTVIEIPWPTVREVHYKQAGIIATLLRHGTVVITTTLLDEPIQLQRVYHPQAIRDILARHASGS